MPKKETCLNCQRICPDCDKVFAHNNSLLTHRWIYHRNPLDNANSNIDCEIKSETPIKDEDKSDEAMDTSNGEQEVEMIEFGPSSSEAVRPAIPELESYETESDYISPQPYWARRALGKLTSTLDPSFDYLDTYEIKNFFVKMKSKCPTVYDLIQGREKMFINAILDCLTLGDVYALIKSRTGLLRNILRKVYDKSPYLADRIESMRFNPDR